MSGWRRQIKLVIIAPYNDSLSRNLFWINDTGNNVIIRISPYPPNFNRIAASTIDPAIGASTWAFGSHRWVENIGNFTRNPVIINIHSNFVFIINGNDIIDVVINNIVDDELLIDINTINIGKDAVIVYIIKYIPAWIRSGW